MAALFLPDRFIARPADEFAAGLSTVQAWYWHRHSKGDMQFERGIGLGAIGSLEAMMWLSGQSPFPPCYSAPLPRTRANLLKLLRYAEMVFDGEGEQVDHEDGAVSIIEHDKMAGAREVYYWAMGVKDHLMGDLLLPEEIRAARRYWQAQNVKESRKVA